MDETMPMHSVNRIKTIVAVLYYTTMYDGVVNAYFHNESITEQLRWIKNPLDGEIQFKKEEQASNTNACIRKKKPDEKLSPKVKTQDFFRLP